MHNQECDILVVGSGPAGAMAASATSQAGYKTIVLDRKPVVGTPVKCAEYIPVQLAGEVTLTRKCIAQSIVGMKTFIAGKLDDTNKARGYMIHRDIFDQSLVNNCLDSGTTCLNNCDFIRLKSANTALIRKKEDDTSFQINFQIIIGADGPDSKVATAAGFCTGTNIPGVQYTLPLLNQEEYTEVHFEKDFFGGYGWFFPKNDVVNIGLGMNRQGSSSTSLKQRLDNFAHKFTHSERVSKTILRKTCGWIPVSPRNSCVKGNILLAGDAAGHTHPVTGAGIFAAVMCGKMAGLAAVDALSRQDIGLLSNYDREWQSLFGKTLTRASSKRIFMETNWDDFEETIKQTWVAYKAYYRKD